MRQTSLLLATLLSGLAWSEASAQGYLRGTSRSGGSEADEDSGRRKSARKDVEEEEVSDEEAEAPRPKKKKKATDGKSLVEEYLRERLSISQKNWHDQKAYGSKSADRWDKFFSELYEDRKRFETSIARHRLNLFETLSSVGADYRAQSVKDFEQMQATMLKSFESSQKKKMDEFFGRLMEDMRSYAADQERKRGELVQVSMEAWQDQKATLAEPENGRKKRD